ncbi:MAG: hypothetical protein WBI04_05245 [Trichlorobacter sp.]|jgi:hypothetical protein
MIWRSTRHRLLKRLQLRESWIIFFIMGNVMINFPFLKIFNQPISILGFPLLFLYFTVGWAASIGVIYLFTQATESDQQTVEEQPPQ